MARTSSKKTTTTTSATVDETIVADTSQNVVVEKTEDVEKKAKKTKETKVEDMEEKLKAMVESTVAQLTKDSELEPLTDTEDIEVEALIPNISYKDDKTADYYEWKNAGDIEEIPFEVLKNMFRNHRFLKYPL